jgi:(p)ppGpp synthase/HD superfamily hydrolase
VTTINILEVAKFACSVHAGDERKYSHLPYSVHLARVAGFTMLLDNACEAWVGAAFLHDSVEDHPNKVSYQILNEKYGQELADIVLGLTNASKLIDSKGWSRAERKAFDIENLSKQSTIVRKIKLIDRYDNVNDIDIVADLKFAKLYMAETAQLLEALDLHDDTEYDDLHQRLNDKVCQRVTRISMLAAHA